MRALIDNDFFCKVGSAGLLERVIAHLGLDFSDCRRLAALEHMLRGGRLATRLGPAHCATLTPLVTAIAAAPAAPIAQLALLVGVKDIDDGDAQLIANAAEHSAMLLSGDKRAIRAAAAVPEIRGRISGRVVCVETASLALCRSLGVEAVRAAYGPLLELDRALKAAFGGTETIAALSSYRDELVHDVGAGFLWECPP